MSLCFSPIRSVPVLTLMGLLTIATAATLSVEVIAVATPVVTGALSDDQHQLLHSLDDDFKTLGGGRTFLRTQAEALEKLKPQPALPLLAYLSGIIARQFFAENWRLNITSIPSESSTESQP